MTERFRVGSTIQRREVLHGQVWLSMPVQVVADDDVLAVWLVDGAPLTFPSHPFGPHPWSAHERWSGRNVLQLHRSDDAYAVWGFFGRDQLEMIKTLPMDNFKTMDDVKKAANMAMKTMKMG